MFKNVSIALLLVVFGLVAGRSIAKSDSAPTSPVIVKRVTVLNQTAPIRTANLFTPSQSGLYRVSVYMAQVIPSHNRTSDFWTLNFGWSDDIGEETSFKPLMTLGANSIPPTDWGSFDQTPGKAVIVQSTAGKPMTYSITRQFQEDDGVYSVYFVVERLM